MGSAKWKHRKNLPQRSWSFSSTCRRCRLCRHKGVSQSQTSPTGGQPCYFCRGWKPPATSRWPQLSSCLGGLHCFPTDLRLCPPSLPPLVPLPRFSRSSSRRRRGSQGSLERTWSLRRPGVGWGLGARWPPCRAHSWRRAPSRIPLSKEARSSAQQITLSNCFPCYSQAGSCESLSGFLPVLQGRREAGGDRGTAWLLHLARGQSAPALVEASSARSPAAARWAARSPAME